MSTKWACTVLSLAQEICWIQKFVRMSGISWKYWRVALFKCDSSHLLWWICSRLCFYLKFFFLYSSCLMHFEVQFHFDWNTDLLALGCMQRTVPVFQSHWVKMGYRGKPKIWSLPLLRLVLIISAHSFHRTAGISFECCFILGLAVTYSNVQELWKNGMWLERERQK